MPDGDRFYAIIDALDTFGINEQEKYLILLALFILFQLWNIVVDLEETCVDIVYSSNTKNILRSSRLSLRTESEGFSDKSYSFPDAPIPFSIKIRIGLHSVL